MKQMILFAGCICFLTVSYSYGQATAGSDSTKTDTAKRWPSSERTGFIRGCINSAKVAMSEDSARHYCFCMQEKVENLYPSITDANKLSAAELQSPEWKKNMTDCLTASHWTTADRQNVLSGCIKAAKESFGETKTKNYCECMLFKAEQKYPNPADIGELTAEKLATPEWKKIAQGCLDF